MGKGTRMEWVVRVCLALTALGFAIYSWDLERRFALSRAEVKHWQTEAELHFSARMQCELVCPKCDPSAINLRGPGQRHFE